MRRPRRGPRGRRCTPAVLIGERSPRGIGYPFGIVERDVVLVDLDRQDELVGASHAEIIARVSAELER